MLLDNLPMKARGNRMPNKVVPINGIGAGTYLPLWFRHR